MAGDHQPTPSTSPDEELIATLAAAVWGTHIAAFVLLIVAINLWV